MADVEKTPKKKHIFRPWEAAGQEIGLKPTTCQIRTQVFDLDGLKPDMLMMLAIDGFTRLAREQSSKPEDDVLDAANGIWDDAQAGTLHERAERGAPGAGMRNAILVRFFADPKAVKQTAEITEPEAAAFWDSWDDDRRKAVSASVRYKFHRDAVQMERLKERQKTAKGAESEPMEL